MFMMVTVTKNDNTNIFNNVYSHIALLTLLRFRCFVKPWASQRTRSAASHWMPLGVEVGATGQAVGANNSKNGGFHGISW